MCLTVLGPRVLPADRTTPRLPPRRNRSGARTLRLARSDGRGPRNEGERLGAECVENDESRLRGFGMIGPPFTARAFSARWFHHSPVYGAYC
jgi:hypothetical protein